MVNNRMRGFVRPAGDPDITFNLDDPDVRAVNGQFNPVSVRASQWARRWDPTAVTYDAQGRALITSNPWSPMALPASPALYVAPARAQAQAPTTQTIPGPVGPRMGSPTSDPLASVAPRSGMAPRGETFDEFYNRCPTRDEAEEILGDFDIEFQPGSGGEQYVKDRRVTHWPDGCYVDPITGLSTLASVVKMFQLMKWFQFGDPLPIIGTKTPYDWVKNVRFIFQRGIKYRIFRNSPALTITSLFNTDFSLGGYMGPVQLLYFASLILHETRHSLPGGAKIHTCNSWATKMAFDAGAPNPYGVWRDDMFLGDGATGLEYWFLVWVRHRTPSGVWSYDFEQYLDNDIDLIWKNNFCNHCFTSDPRMAGPAPLDPSLLCSGVQQTSSAGDALLAATGRQTVIPSAPLDMSVYEPSYGIPILSWPRPAWFYDPKDQAQLAARVGVPWEFLKKKLTVV